MGSRTRVGDARPARLLYLLRHIKTKRHRMLRDPLSPSFFSSSLNRAAPRLPKYITVGAAVRRAVRAAGAGRARARARSLGQSVSLREERGDPWQAWRTTRCRPSAAAAAAAVSCRGREIIGLAGGRRTQVLRGTVPCGSSVRLCFFFSLSGLALSTVRGSCFASWFLVLPCVLFGVSSSVWSVVAGREMAELMQRR